MKVCILVMLTDKLLASEYQSNSEVITTHLTHYASLTISLSNRLAILAHSMQHQTTLS